MPTPSCGSCKTPKSNGAKRHCTSPTCSWWTCRVCKSICDAGGRYTGGRVA